MANRFCFAAFNILMPYPRTPLHDRLAAQRRLLWDGRWWLHPEYRFNHAAFVPKNMSPDDLTEACWQCRFHWNKTSSIFRRMWDFKTHLSSPARLAVYLGYNPLYAREAYTKQGMLFGLFRRHQPGRALPEGAPAPPRDGRGPAGIERLVTSEGVSAFFADRARSA
jgi:hypothetical protein